MKEGHEEGVEGRCRKSWARGPVCLEEVGRRGRMQQNINWIQCKSYFSKCKEKTLPSLIRLGRVSPYFYIMLVPLVLASKKSHCANAALLFGHVRRGAAVGHACVALAIIFFVGFVDLAHDARSRLHGTTEQPRYEAAVPSDPFPQADAGKVRDLRPGGGEG